jgi:O-Antigen ligase
VRANQPLSVEVDVRNAGRLTWTTSENHPFVLGYRWLTDDGSGVLDIPPSEVRLDHDVEPGETIHLHAGLSVPDLPSGRYRLDWGMLQRDVLQFYERGWADAETRVVVDGPAGGSMPEVTPRDDAEAPWVVGRLDLWGAALKLAAAHPVLGLGPDNFRHFYGAELGLEGWDERIQANNLYLELLADLGFLGLAAFTWVVAEPLLHLGRKLNLQSGVSRWPDGDISLGVGLAVGAFLLHGLVDSFLVFTPTVFLFWLLLGVAQKPQVSGR